MTVIIVTLTVIVLLLSVHLKPDATCSNLVIKRLSSSTVDWVQAIDRCWPTGSRSAEHLKCQCSNKHYYLHYNNSILWIIESDTDTGVCTVTIIMPRCACASEVYGSVSVCVSVWTVTAAP